MRFIHSRVHGVLDYATGLLLLAAPSLLGFADGGAAQIVPMLLGAGAILYSLLTDYELSLRRLIPLPVHLLFDVGSGVLLAASPFLFGFADRVMWQHVVIGVFEIAAGLTTRTTPDTAGPTARGA